MGVFQTPTKTTRRPEVEAFRKTVEVASDRQKEVAGTGWRETRMYKIKTVFNTAKSHIIKWVSHFGLGKISQIILRLEDGAETRWLAENGTGALIVDFEMERDSKIQGLFTRKKRPQRSSYTRDDNRFLDKTFLYNEYLDLRRIYHHNHDQK